MQKKRLLFLVGALALISHSKAAPPGIINHQGQLQYSLPILNGAVATSGLHPQSYGVNEGQAVHIIDPSHGRPIQGKVTQVTIIHDTAMFADGWATAMMVLGLEKGLETADRLTIPALFFVEDADGTRLYPSKSFRAFYT